MLKWSTSSKLFLYFPCVSSSAFLVSSSSSTWGVISSTWICSWVLSWLSSLIFLLRSALFSFHWLVNSSSLFVMLSMEALSLEISRFRAFRSLSCFLIVFSLWMSFSCIWCMIFWYSSEAASARAMASELISSCVVSDSHCSLCATTRSSRFFISPACFAVFFCAASNSSSSFASLALMLCRSSPHFLISTLASLRSSSLYMHFVSRLACSTALSSRAYSYLMRTSSRIAFLSLTSLSSRDCVCRVSVWTASWEEACRSSFWAVERSFSCSSRRAMRLRLVSDSS